MECVAALDPANCDQVLRNAGRISKSACQYNQSTQKKRDLTEAIKDFIAHPETADILKMEKAIDESVNETVETTQRQDFQDVRQKLLKQFNEG